MLGSAFSGPSDLSFDFEAAGTEGAEFEAMTLRFDMPDDNAQQNDLELEWDGAPDSQVRAH